MIFAKTDNSLLAFREFTALLDAYGMSYVYEFGDNGTIEWYIEGDDLYFDTDYLPSWCYGWEWVEDTDEDPEEYANYLRYVREL